MPSFVELQARSFHCLVRDPTAFICFVSDLLISGHALFVNLGLGPGSSLLGGLSIIMIPPLYLLYRYGAQLRAKSKYATA